MGGPVVESCYMMAEKISYERAAQKRYQRNVRQNIKNSLEKPSSSSSYCLSTE